MLTTIWNLAESCILVIEKGLPPTDQAQDDKDLRLDLQWDVEILDDWSDRTLNRSVINVLEQCYKPQKELQL